VPTAGRARVALRACDAGGTLRHLRTLRRRGELPGEIVIALGMHGIPRYWRTALTRLYTVENATSTLSPGVTRTAPGVTHILLAAHCAVMCLSRPGVPPSRLPHTSHPRAVRPYRGMPCMPSATTISAGISSRRRSVRSCRAADERSATPASHVRIATRARPAVGTLPAAAASPRSPWHPAAVAPLPAAGATRARDKCAY